MKPEIYIQRWLHNNWSITKKNWFKFKQGGGAKFYLESNKVLINNKKLW